MLGVVSDTPDAVRAALYSILARLYGEALTPDCAGELHDAGFFADLAEMEAGFVEPASLDALDYEGLAVEYTRLFCGPGPHAAPYASVHHPEDQRTGQLWGEVTGEVKRFMAHYGLEPAYPGGVPDHLGSLCRFMHRVLEAKLDAAARSDAAAVQEADRIMGRFFQRYLSPWVARFVAQARRLEPAPLYAALLALTEEFVAQEADLFRVGDRTFES